MSRQTSSSAIFLMSSSNILLISPYLNIKHSSQQLTHERAQLLFCFRIQRKVEKRVRCWHFRDINFHMFARALHNLIVDFCFSLLFGNDFWLGRGRRGCR
mmetsp:Transcript_9947/g.37091  ORF Transcript_9947/g.37091 Transcript_9947/m.37091 type:complete len:100 (-) Transcript_9947:1258-1557(-)